MATVNVQQAKTQLSALLARAEAGEDIVIARAGVPVARLAPVVDLQRRPVGTLELEVPDDFDHPLPEDEVRAWE